MLFSLAVCFSAFAFCLGAIRVRTPSRLHFGLLSLPGQDRWPNSEGQRTLTARRFGGVGLMIESPAVQLVAEPSPAWAAEGPLADRALEFARRFALSTPGADLPPHRLRIEHAPPQHIGLGVGTQLGLAVARALVQSTGLETMASGELALRVGRGNRSALGIHGFALGGFLVEAGKAEPEHLSPLVARIAFPDDWRLIVVMPPGGQGLHGADEQEAFHRLQSLPMDLATTDSLCRLALLGMLPALAERDFASFSEALYDFNLRAGSAFAPVQGGCYAAPQTAELVAWIQRRGVRGVGQSSWGPTVFAVAPDEARGAHLVESLRHGVKLEPARVLMTRASNLGAQTEEL
jgi:beta-RFAP synthase